MTVGPANQLLLAQVSHDAEVTELGSLLAGYPVLSLELVSGADGVWLTYITDEPGLPLYMSVLSAQGELLQNLQLSSASAGAMAAVRIGDLLALAYTRSSQRIELELRDAEGTLVATETVRAPADISGALTGPISLLAAPDEDALLLAWSDDDEKQLVHVARFDCSP
jgi:hypothetical protein